MKGVVTFATFVAVLATLWKTTLAETDDEWLAELKADISKTKLK